MYKYGQAKFGSDTFDLPSKHFLQLCRKREWKGSLIQKGIDLDLAMWWEKKEEIETELICWMKADIRYEKGKEELKGELEKLSTTEINTYFKEIKIENQTLEIWLKPSPAKGKV